MSGHQEPRSSAPTKASGPYPSIRSERVGGLLRSCTRAAGYQVFAQKHEGDSPPPRSRSRPSCQARIGKFGSGFRMPLPVVRGVSELELQHLDVW